MNSAVHIHLYSEQKLEKKRLGALPVYFTKSAERPYKKFTLLDTYDLVLNSADIVLSANNNRLTWADESSSASASLSKATPPYRSDMLGQSPMKKYLTNAIGMRPLLAECLVSLAVRTFSITEEESGLSIKVVEKRSANSRSGYWYALHAAEGSEGLLKQIKKALLVQGFSGITPAKYLEPFFAQDKYAIINEKPAAVTIINGNESLEDVMKSVLLSTGNRLGIIAGFFSGPYDPELLHDFRVNLRALRGILFQKPHLYNLDVIQTYKKLFSEMSVKSSAARDLDVFFDNPAHNNFKDRHPELYSAMRKKQSKYIADWCAFCTSPEVKATLDGWEKFVHMSPMAEYDTFLSFCYERLRHIKSDLKKRLKKYSEKRSPQNTHNLRIAIKRYRYHLDYMQPVSFERDKQHIIKLTKKVQMVLGSLNDRFVQKEMLMAYFDAAGVTPDRSEIKHLLIAKPDKKEVKLAVHTAKSFLR